jgi:hypothetical protein
MNPEAVALRLVLAYDRGGNQDALVAALTECIGRGCPGCTADVVLVLLSMITARINCDAHRGELVAMIHARLMELLDADAHRDHGTRMDLDDFVREFLTDEAGTDDR